MPESLHEQIHREMAEAFDGGNQRAMSGEAREALRKFIEHAVEGGIRGDAALYDRYRDYLRCRFRHVANGINQRVGADGTVTWEDIAEVAKVEVGHPRGDCFRLIVPAPGSEAEGVGLEARICGEFTDAHLARPETAAR